MATTPEKQREYTREHYRRNKQVYKDRAKANTAKRVAKLNLIKQVPCMDCGVSYPPYVLDFDHREDEEKLGNIANMVRVAAWQKVLDEIAKCDIVCGNCHRVRTHNRNIKRL